MVIFFFFTVTKYGTKVQTKMALHHLQRHFLNFYLASFYRSQVVSTSDVLLKQALHDVLRLHGDGALSPLCSICLFVQ